MKAKNQKVLNQCDAWQKFLKKIELLNISENLDISDSFICLYTTFYSNGGLHYYLSYDGEIRIHNIEEEETISPTFLEMKILGAVFYYYTCYLKEIGFIKVD